MTLTASDLSAIARGNSERALTSVDPLDPNVALAFTTALAVPRHFDEVERIERASKDLFHEVLSADQPADDALVAAFIEFFYKVGFLFKFKPYGVKIASPFGYSVFDLHDGLGFSFQLHTEPKFEAFHILHARDQSFVYLSSRAEWEAKGHLAAQAWVLNRRSLASHYAFRPEPGDVVRISSTEVVHSVVGCTLEEFATCSVDAVERLFDQNPRSNVPLPWKLPRLAAMLRLLHPNHPRRLLSRSDDGWKTLALTDEPILEVPGQLLGRRVALAPDAAVNIPVPSGWLTVVVPVTNSVRCSVDGRSWFVQPGQLLATPGGREVVVRSDRAGLLSVHSIARALVLRDWS